MPHHDSSMSRRALVAGASTTLALMALPGSPVRGHQQATPGSSPGATPAASPATPPFTFPTAAPTPPPIPETSLRIVTDMKPVYTDEPIKDGDLHVYIRSEGLDNYNPTAQVQDVLVNMCLLDPLVAIDPVTMEPRPALATKWSWSADNLRLTFTLRPGVSWHNGQPFTPADVVFSFLAYRDDYDSTAAGIFALVNDVQAKGNNQVVVSFAEPDGAFLYNGASMGIFSSAQLSGTWNANAQGEQSLSANTDVLIGTGPWKFGGKRDNFLMVVRHDGYWGDVPNFKRLFLIAEDDPRKRIEGWKKGDVDILDGLRATDLDGLWEQDGTLYVADSPTTFFAAFNFANPANVTPDMMKDSALRSALTRAVDRKRYADEIFHTFIDEKATGTITQPWAHLDTLTNPAFNIDEANGILDNAGWFDSNGDGMREDSVGNYLDLYLIVADNERPELLAIVDRLAGDFAKIGARLTVQKLPFDQLDDRWVENRQYDMVAFSLVQYPAFNEYDLYGTAWDIRVNTRGWNPGAYSNPNADAAISAWFAATQPNTMKAAMSDLQQSVNDDLFGLWFGFPKDLVLAKPDIQGYTPNMFHPLHDLHRTWRGPDAVAPEVETATPVPAASPQASPAGSPEATPVGTPQASPNATPVRP